MKQPRRAHGPQLAESGILEKMRSNITTNLPRLPHSPAAWQPRGSFEELTSNLKIIPDPEEPESPFRQSPDQSRLRGGQALRPCSLQKGRRNIARSPRNQSCLNLHLQRPGVWQQFQDLIWSLLKYLMLAENRACGLVGLFLVGQRHGRSEKHGLGPARPKLYNYPGIIALSFYPFP